MTKQIYLNKKILIISSHADDHISCAGTVFKLQEEQGMIPFELVLTDSSRGQDFRAEKTGNRKVVSTMRAKELSEASQFLGIRQTFFLKEPDMGLQIRPELLFAVAKIIRLIQPQIIFINGEFDAHPDHRAAFRISLDAIKLAAMGVETKKLGPLFRTPVVLCTEQMLPDRIQILVDITRFIGKKDQLLAIYKSQMSPKSLAFEKGMIAVRGYHLRKSDGFAAEAFTLQNEFPILGFEEDGGLLG
jgi:LmbE family N-acetylglucosaminyl deacetylase